jgi:hypothetical protein
MVKTSDGNPVFWKRLTLGIAVGWMAAGLVWVSLWDHYVRTRPREMQNASGRVIPLHSHGFVVYLTEDERNRLRFLNRTVEVFAVSFLLTLFVDRAMKKLR